MKKIALFFMIGVFVFTLSACDSTHEITFELPDGDVYDTRNVEPGESATTPMPSLPGKHFLGWYVDEDYTEMFDRTTPVENDVTLYGKTVPFEGNNETPVTDMLKLDESDFEGKVFQEDGIGEVSLGFCIDGDTTSFSNALDSDIRVRYLFTDTPESTAVIEPWGIESSDYVCDVLQDAQTIVLEYEPHPDEGHPEVHPSIGKTGNYSRDLATVWYEGRNLNLETVELGYSPASGVGNSQFGEYYRLAENNANANNLRLGGDDQDPMFEASPQDVTVEELQENPEEYMHTFVNIEGVITDTSQDGFTICNDGHSFYVYTGSQSHSTAIRSNRQVSFEKLFLTTYFESYQLTNYSNDRFEVLDSDVEPECGE